MSVFGFLRSCRAPQPGREQMPWRAGELAGVDLPKQGHHGLVLHLFKRLLERRQEGGRVRFAVRADRPRRRPARHQRYRLQT